MIAPAAVNSATLEGEISPVDRELMRLEERAKELQTELSAVERRLRELRIASELCAECGGTGERQVRGGMYGERHTRTCECQQKKCG